jgi:hypothetical protein
MQALLGTETIHEFLAELAGLAIRAVGDGLSCGITLQPNGRPVTMASTDALAARDRLIADVADFRRGLSLKPPHPPHHTRPCTRRRIPLISGTVHSGRGGYGLSGQYQEEVASPSSF